ncbi:MAG TPA: TlpA disulfide reductase family protein [Flavitalea sp.]|nr:TlpA disulfide reductase family protein [Flavitalea sp.]
MFKLNVQRFFLLLVCHASMLANAAGEPKPTTITCKVNTRTGSGVFLYKLESGEAVSLGFRRPDEIADTCIFSLPLEKEGVYFLRKAGVHSPQYRNVIYLKPGDNKQVDIYLSQSSIDFDSCKVQNPNKETTYLQDWLNRFNNLYKLGTNQKNREEFIAAYNQLIKDASRLKAEAVPGNRYFNRMFAGKLDAEILYLKAAAFFNFGERMNSLMDTVEQRRSFYRSLAGQRFCDARILHSAHGQQLVRYCLGYNLYHKFGSQKQMLETGFTDKAAMVCNDDVRRALVENRMQQVTNYAQFKTEIQPFKKLFVSAESKILYQKKEDELTVYAKGAPAYNFSLNDTKDQLVSLSDFKGKVVVLDIWAMWCAPCLSEKPFFQKVEDSFKGRDDVVFIGISHDGLAKKEVWKQFVAKKGWKNIELLANYNESIGKYYKIEGIPRFMIFDKEGKIVTVDAPRPSNPEFKKIIEQTLKTEERVTNR